MHISYTKQAANAVRYAAKKAKEMKHPYIGTEHLLSDCGRSFRGLRDRCLRKTALRQKRSCSLWMN